MAACNALRLFTSKVQHFCPGLCAFLIVLVAMATAGAGGEAQPTTPPKEWRRTYQEVKHSDKRLEQLLTEVAPVMQLQVEDLERLITDKATFYDLPCPVCPKVAQQSYLGYRGKWTMDDPFHITCRECETTYPNEKHRETATVELTLPSGKKQVYHYYPGPQGEQYYFTEAARQHLTGYLHSAARKLGETWVRSQDPAHARQALRIVIRYMQIYPDIPIHGSDGNDMFRKKFLLDPPYIDSQCTKFGRYSSDVIPMALVNTYDFVYDAPVYEELTAEYGFDVRAFIENGFRDSVRLSFQLNPVSDQILRTALCLGDPILLHRSVRGIYRDLTTVYCADGLDARGVGYHRPAAGLMDLLNSWIKGYSDPPGYRDMDDGSRFDDLDLGEVRPALWSYLRERTGTIRGRLSYPDGQLPPVHDAWPQQRWLPKGESLERSQPQLVPGWGHSVLGYGKGERQVQAHLHFSFLAGHGHADVLSFFLWGEGREWLGEYGYSHGALRAWSASSLAHNAVLIDEKCQSYRRDGHVRGSLLLYEPLLPGGLQLTEADGRRAYDRLVSDLKTYRRELLLVPVGESGSYVVDIFRVEGGKRHDWVIHAAVGTPESLEVDLPLEPMPGTLAGPDKKTGDVKLWPDEVREERDSEYGLVDELRGARADGPWKATIRPEGTPEGPALHLRMLAEKGRQIVVGRAPNPRRGIAHEGSRILLCRSSGGRNAFAAVWEPSRKEPLIQSVERLKVRKGDDAWAVGLRVRLSNGQTHDILSAPQGSLVEFEEGYRLQGRFGFVAGDANGKPLNAFLLAGKELRRGADLAVTADAPSWEGTVLRSHGPAEDEKEPALDVAGALPVGKEFAGRCLIVTHADGTTNGHVILRVEHLAEGRQRVHVQDDPGYEITERNVAINEPTLPMLMTRFLYTRPSSPRPSAGPNSGPRRVIEGGINRYRVNVAAVAKP